MVSVDVSTMFTYLHPKYTGFELSASGSCSCHERPSNTKPSPLFRRPLGEKLIAVVNRAVIGTAKEPCGSSRGSLWTSTPVQTRLARDPDKNERDFYLLKPNDHAGGKILVSRQRGFADDDKRYLTITLQYMTNTPSVLVAVWYDSRLKSTLWFA